MTDNWACFTASLTTKGWYARIFGTLPVIEEKKLMQHNEEKYLAFVEGFKKCEENESRKMTFIHLPTEEFLKRLSREIPSYHSDKEARERNLQAAAEGYIEKIGASEFEYSSRLSTDLKRSIDEEDWIRLHLFNEVFWVKSPLDISESLSYCIDKLVQYSFLEVRLSPEKQVEWDRGFMIEWFVDMIEYYRNPIAVSSLKKVCTLPEEDDIGAVRKAIEALCGIKTQEAFQVIIYCMQTHPEEWIREQATGAISYFQRGGLVDEARKWIKK